MQAQDLRLFQAALGLSEPWEVVSVEFDPAQKRLDLRIDFAKGARFPCPECGAADCPVHDTEEKAWRHLDFFQHQAFLTARVPRVVCPEHKVRLVEVPWARPLSGGGLIRSSQHDLGFVLIDRRSDGQESGSEAVAVVVSG